MNTEQFRNALDVSVADFVTFARKVNGNPVIPQPVVQELLVDVRKVVSVHALTGLDEKEMKMCALIIERARGVSRNTIVDIFKRANDHTLQIVAAPASDIIDEAPFRGHLKQRVQGLLDFAKSVNSTAYKRFFPDKVVADVMNQCGNRFKIDGDQGVVPTEISAYTNLISRAYHFPDHGVQELLVLANQQARALTKGTAVTTPEPAIA